MARNASLRWPDTLTQQGLQPAVPKRLGTIRRLLAVFAPKLVDPSRSIDNFLFTRIERMARGTDFDVQLFFQSRTRFELVSTAANDLKILVFGMDLGFHDGVFRPVVSRFRLAAGRGRIAVRPTTDKPETGPGASIHRFCG